MTKIAVGLSGGVDSSVAAFQLKQNGYDVFGLYMKNWSDSTFTLVSDCSYEEDRNMAELAAHKIGIPFYEVDLSNSYKERIVNYMFREYEMGRTPNPDILCNREIKFDLFITEAKKLGADKIATGHYVTKYENIISGQKVYSLHAGTDKNKDQSYFLAQLTQEQIADAEFPVGHLTKSEVREIARVNNIPTANRKDSQGICFIGKISLPDFLQQQLKPKKGPIIEIPESSSKYTKSNLGQITKFEELKYLSNPYNYTAEEGKNIGTHKGAHFFTIGQRKGLNVGGTPEPLFVIAIDIQNNIVFVGQGKNHPGLYRNGLFIAGDEAHWIRTDKEMYTGEIRYVEARIRYRQPLQSALLWRQPEGYYMLFRRPQRAITSGQFAAWYKKGEILGSGVIKA